MAEKSLTFGIKVPVDTNAEPASNSIDELRKRILASQEAVKAYGSTLRNLRGSSDEVKTAKEKLKAAVNAERDAISRGTLALGKQGTTFADASKKAKEAAAATTSVKDALSAAGGPLASLSGRFETFTGIVGGGSAAAGLFTLGLASLAAAAVVITGAFAAAAVSVAKFILEEGNALRTMGLFREAATGSAENAKAFGHQIDALGAKIPTPRKELNELSLSLSRALAGTRVSGQGIVDTFNAVAQTSAAMGDQAGSAIQEVITRGKMMGRLGLGINELQGTGVGFQDVAAQLAKNLKIGINQAQQQLFMGRVKIDDGAKAIRDVVERKFGGINLRRMLDINVIAAKFKDALSHLTEDVKLEPLLEGVSKLAKLFDTSTVTGAALKSIITNFGNALSKAFVASLPFIETFFNQLVIDSLELEIALIRVGKWADKTFGTDFISSIGGADTAIAAAQITFGLLAASVAVVAVGVAALATPFVLAGAAMYECQKIGASVYAWFSSTDWASIGSNIVNGIIEGMTSAPSKLFGAVTGVASNIKKTFTGALDIHSPSRVFKKYGEQTTEGYSEGVDDGKGGVATSVANMVSMPKGGGVGGGNGGGNIVHVTLSLSFPEVKDGAGVLQAMQGPGVKAQIQAFFDELLAQNGGAPENT